MRIGKRRYSYHKAKQMDQKELRHTSAKTAMQMNNKNNVRWREHRTELEMKRVEVQGRGKEKCEGTKKE